MYKVGDEVLVRFFNGVEKVYYGETYICEILAVDIGHSEGRDYRGRIVYKPYLIKATDSSFSVWVKENEVVSGLKKCTPLKLDLTS